MDPLQKHGLFHAREHVEPVPAATVETEANGGASATARVDSKSVGA